MAMTLKRRFEEQGIPHSEVVRFAALFGTNAAMERYRVKGYLAFKKYLKEVAGDDRVGINPLIPSLLAEGLEKDYRPLVYTLADALGAKIAGLEETNVKQAERIAFLEKQLSFYQASDYDRAGDALKPLIRLITSPEKEKGKEHPLLRAARQESDIINAEVPGVDDQPAPVVAEVPSYDVLAEVKVLLNGEGDIEQDIDAMQTRLSEAYKEACHNGDWKRANDILYHGVIMRPYCKEEYYEVLAREWLIGAEKLLA